MTDHDDDLRLVASFREDLDDATPERLASVRATFLKQQKGSTMTARRAFLTPSRIAVVALPAVAAIALGAVALGSLGGETTPESPGVTGTSNGLAVDADAAAVLRYTALNTGRYTGAEHSTGDYVYVRDTFYLADDPENLDVRESWHEIDFGMFMVLLIENGEQLMPDPSNPKEDIEAERAETAEYLATHGPSLSIPTRDYLASLPEDAEGMLAALRGGHAETEAHVLFKKGFSVLTTTGETLAPAQRSALFEALATLDGVTRADGTVDVLGRTGVAIGFEDESGAREEIVIDPETSDVLGTRYRAPGEDGWSVQASSTKVVAEPGDTE
ncbi:CU044_5270 family protein [Phytomonospora endophytica]|uniref:CU044_5270 family protein n=1 Tax=Phytomonospora endophytica TaxID=714109 RepID=A0A841FW62_9ACTN|nr:CU044_5270 family protein [Phytomonospora endophytica]MBB6038993.1 hypothetical protein [Phytomonospora endophytica]GIG67903.1 hypothetical protein Pen01_41980 [Phytomonospora endophytica]